MVDDITIVLVVVIVDEGVEKVADRTFPIDTVIPLVPVGVNEGTENVADKTFGVTSINRVVLIVGAGVENIALNGEGYTVVSAVCIVYAGIENVSVKG
jgi:hypothetical protein